MVGTDSKKDLALIKLENAPSGLKVATLNSDGVQVGDDVVAIGSPEGLTGTVTSGIVLALNRDVTVSTDESQGQQRQQGGGSGQWPFSFGGQQFNGDTGSSTTTYKAIQTDASLNPGNSGGALIDMNGNIVGINSAMYSAANSSSSSSSAGSVGLGFAIPINTVKSDLASLRAGSSDSSFSAKSFSEVEMITRVSHGIEGTDPRRARTRPSPSPVNCTGRHPGSGDDGPAVAEGRSRSPDDGPAHLRRSPAPPQGPAEPPEPPEPAERAGGLSRRALRGP